MHVTQLLVSKVQTLSTTTIQGHNDTTLLLITRINTTLLYTCLMLEEL